MPPQITIREPLKPTYRGEKATFTARPTDTDGSLPHVEWNAQSGTCPDDALVPSAFPVPMRSGAEFPDVLVNDTVCVRARATDSSGAIAVDALEFTAKNHLPTPDIRLMAPMASANAAMMGGTFPVKTVFVFGAEGSIDVDPPDANDLKFSWTLAINGERVDAPECPDDPRHLHACFTANVAGSFDLGLTVKDLTGEEAVLHRALGIVAGQRPTAHLDVVAPSSGGPYQLGKPIRLSAERSIDVDATMPLVPVFKVVGPDDVEVQSTDCGLDQQLIRCFTPMLPGSYTAEVTIISDGDKDVDSKQLVVAEDRLPCIGMTSPVRQQSEPDRRSGIASELTTFTLNSIDDDLDGAATNQDINALYVDWFVLRPKATTFSLAHSGATFSIPKNDFGVGDEIQVRLQIRDRNTARSNDHFASCTGPSCPSTDGCFQRWTWTVKFIDSNANPNAAPTN
jgi:hypothetical protein